MEKFVYGNFLTGERVEVPMAIIVINCEEEYDRFLRNVLKKFDVKCPHPILTFAIGSYLIVVSGEGLTFNGGKAVLVNTFNSF